MQFINTLNVLTDSEENFPVLCGKQYSEFPNVFLKWKIEKIKNSNSVHP